VRIPLNTADYGRLFDVYMMFVSCTGEFNIYTIPQTELLQRILQQQYLLTKQMKIIDIYILGKY